MLLDFVIDFYWNTGALLKTTSLYTLYFRENEETQGNGCSAVD